MSKFLKNLTKFFNYNRASVVPTPNSPDLIWITNIDLAEFEGPEPPNITVDAITSIIGYVRVRFGSKVQVTPHATTTTTRFQRIDSVEMSLPPNAPRSAILQDSIVPHPQNVVLNVQHGNITLYVYCLDRHIKISIDQHASTTELCNLLYGWANKVTNITDTNVAYVYKSGLSCIVPDRKISDYNLADGSRINIMVCPLVGGSKILTVDQVLLPTYSHVQQCESQLLHSYNLQSDEELIDSENLEAITEKLTGMLPYVSTTQKETIVWLISQFEKLLSVSYWYRKCESYTDYTMLTLTAYQTFTGKSVTKDFIHKSLIFNLQSEEDIGDILKTLRKGFTTYENVKENAFMKRIVSIYSYLLVHGFLQKFGLSLNDDEFSRMEKKILLSNYSSKKEMFICICETTLFICEKLYEFKLTGEINLWGNDAVSYEDWFLKADKIISLAPYTSNLTPHGMSYFEFIAELKDLIEKGNAYTRFIEKNNGCTYALMHKKLLSLKMVESTELTRRSAMKERKAPMGVLVHGTSSVAKSTFSKMLFYYYAALHGLSSEDHYRYVRNPADEYWSNFDTSKWCVQLDDIAFLHPGKSSEADPTLMELLNVVNNVPYVPPQAALEDKGRTPVLAQLVVATSNAADLNAHEYFWCPLAIRRRLPYVVEVRPKQEYMHENGRFIDPLKLTGIEGVFPDYWIITVSKIVPFFDGQRDLAKLETVQEFDDINLFLKHFGEASLAHLANQNKSDICDKEMKTLRVCPICLMVTSLCQCNVQLQVSANERLFWRLYYFVFACLTGVWWKFWMSVAACDYFLKFNLWMGRYKMVRYLTTRYLSNLYPRKTFLQIQSTFAKQVCTNKHWLLFVSTLGLVVVFLKCITKDKSKKTEHDDQYEVQTTEEDRFAALKAKVVREERNNVWYNSSIETASFEIPVSSQCFKNKTEYEMRDHLSNNILHVNIRFSREGTPKIYRTGGVVITNNIILVNNHTLPLDVDEFEVELVSMLATTGVNANLKMRLMSGDIIRAPECDMAIFKASSLPPRKDITKFWGENLITISKAIVLQRESSGELVLRTERNVVAYPDFYLHALNRTILAYMTKSNNLTRTGDCGSLLINMTPQGPVISGVHTFGDGYIAGFSHVKKSVLDKMITDLGKISLLPFNVQGSFGPDLSKDGKMIPIVSLHHKSVFRYIEHGTALLYGSLNLPRVKPKSSVQETILSKEMQSHFNIVNKYGKPAMDGWEPWRKNIVEMVQPPVKMDASILKHCVQEFTRDILENLPSNWEKELFFLNKLESVNGIPGVLFIDRINVSSSMGFPWNTAKKKFVSSTINPENADEITFSDDVWERYDNIVAKYEMGERAFPVFTGHLKDEATALEKVAIKKTRLFTGAPIDWSLVVRSRLLSFVRLLQLNKFIFEAGPGTVCQSTEWGEIYEYLTAYGEDRIVAGDYGKYDKRMIADIILAAFEIIVNIHRAAGFSENELLQIATIGYDIAFSIVNLNGDLVGFFGTEPSGHPLTVIVNSLVNSLYMRYSYTLLNPAKSCADFKRNVNLFTYGDRKSVV